MHICLFILMVCRLSSQYYYEVTIFLYRIAKFIETSKIYLIVTLLLSFHFYVIVIKWLWAGNIHQKTFIVRSATKTGWAKISRNVYYIVQQMYSVSEAWRRVGEQKVFMDSLNKIYSVPYRCVSKFIIKTF